MIPAAINERRPCPRCGADVLWRRDPLPYPLHHCECENAMTEAPTPSAIDRAIHDVPTPRVHELKTWPEFFGRLLDGSKPFELRRDDRDFQLGDELHLREWEPRTTANGAPDRGAYTGRELRRRISYLLRAHDGVVPGFAVLGLAPQPDADLRRQLADARALADKFGTEASVAEHREAARMATLREISKMRAIRPHLPDHWTPDQVVEAVSKLQERAEKAERLHEAAEERAEKAEAERDKQRDQWDRERAAAIARNLAALNEREELERRLAALAPATSPSQEKALREALARETASKNAAYKERNALVAALSKLFPASLERHQEDDRTWEDDWRWIVFIDLPTGQASWHIHDSDLPMFAHLPRLAGRVWDGHNTERKYERLAALAALAPATSPSQEKVLREALENAIDLCKTACAHLVEAGERRTADNVLEDLHTTTRLGRAVLAAAPAAPAVRHPFAMSELYAGAGGMRCEHAGCTAHDSSVWLTAAEWADLWRNREQPAELRIFQRRMGVVRCAQHTDALAAAPAAVGEGHDWRRHYNTVRDERAASFAMLAKAVGGCGCTEYQPEIDLEIRGRIVWLRDTLFEAAAAVKAYAADHPKWHHPQRGEQDPYWAHRTLAKIDAYFAQVNPGAAHPAPPHAGPAVTDEPMPLMASFPDDMGSDNYLCVDWQDDGDIVLTIKRGAQTLGQVEFCASGTRFPGLAGWLRQAFARRRVRAAALERGEGAGS